MTSDKRAAWWALVTATLASGVVPVTAQAAAPREIVVTEAGRNRPVHLAPGDRLRVVLPANGTTGFTWVAARVPVNLRKVSARYEPAASPVGVVGAGGQQTLLFDARRPGSGVLRLRYRQPWDGGMAGDTFIMRVAVGR